MGCNPFLLHLLLLMAEILHQLIGSLSHYLQGFIHPRWLAGFQPSTVVGKFHAQPPFSSAFSPSHPVTPVGWVRSGHFFLELMKILTGGEGWNTLPETNIAPENRPSQ